MKALTEAAETDEARVSVESVYNKITEIVAAEIEKRARSKRSSSRRRTKRMMTRRSGCSKSRNERR